MKCALSYIHTASFVQELLRKKKRNIASTGNQFICQPYVLKTKRYQYLLWNNYQP